LHEYLFEHNLTNLIQHNTAQVALH
jgi:hypothetical protein